MASDDYVLGSESPRVPSPDAKKASHERQAFTPSPEQKKSGDAGKRGPVHYASTVPVTTQAARSTC